MTERMDLFNFIKAYCMNSYPNDVCLVEKDTELEYRIASKWKKLALIDFNRIEPEKYFLPVTKTDISMDGDIILTLSDDFVQELRKILSIQNNDNVSGEIIEKLDLFDISYMNDGSELTIMLKNGLLYIADKSWNMLADLNLDEISKGTHYIPITRRERSSGGHCFHISIDEAFEKDLIELFNKHYKRSDETKTVEKETVIVSRDDFDIDWSDSREEFEDDEYEVEEYNAENNRPIPLISVILELVIYMFLLVQNACVLLVEDLDIYMPIAIGCGIIIFVISTIVTFSVGGVHKITKGAALFSLVTFVLSILCGILAFSTDNMRIIMPAIGLMHLSLSHLMYTISSIAF